MDPQWNDFNREVSDLYKHLYDLVYLRTHPFVDHLFPSEATSRRDKGWRMHKLLLDAIEALHPGKDAPPFSVPWRRYHLMLSRFVDGLSPDEVARELAVSRRQYFREQKEALEKAAEVLWHRYNNASTSASRDLAVSPANQTSLEHLELLRLETARVKQASRYAHVDEVMKGVASLLEEVLRQRDIKLQTQLPSSLPLVSANPNMLRQMLLGVLGGLAELVQRATLNVRAEISASSVRLSIIVSPPISLYVAQRSGLGDQLSALEELAALSQMTFSRRVKCEELQGFEIVLAIVQRTILVVDDNLDVLELFQRYLEPYRYRVIIANGAKKALRLAQELHPDIITLDLMMPEQDGWDVLQTLLHQPDTQGIPIIVCSVLNQKTLALSLGAMAFLPKPVTQEELIATIQTLI